jgi:predicted Zn finger-like uncharacterized protein
MQITHCPQCETAFKVSPQQLELAKGWVRCGRCAHVFEAHLYFETAPELPAVATPSVDAPSLFRAGVAPAATVSLDTQKADSATLDAPLVSRADLPWWVATAVLALVFIWQVLLISRHNLAAEEPALRPVLSVLCGGCEITWPREPDAVLIESSSFTENPAGGYTVQLRLKNMQHHPVATPALELTLTDMQDQVLIRRVFLASELTPKDHVQALRDVRVTLNFDLDDKVSKRVTGFRAIIFYP